MRVATKPDRLAVLAGLGMAAFAAASHAAFKGWALSFFVAAAFALIAWLLGGVDITGSIAGATLAFLFLRMAGWPMFIVLLSVFVVTFLATKVGHGEKTGRGAMQVMANLLIPSIVLMLPSLPQGVLAVAALAELTADTTSSEIGERFGKRTYLLTTFRPVAPGTNGGVSLAGTIAGAVAAFAIGTIALFVGIRGQMGAAALAGFLGMLMDSLLGATFENKLRVNNEAVNLCGTASAVAIAWMLLRLSA